MTLVKFKNRNGEPMERFDFLPHVFNNFSFPEFPGKDLLRTSPAVNIAENKNDFHIELAVPGMTKNDFKIEVEGGMLSVSAEKSEEKKDENSRYTRREFSYLSFKRSFTLSESVDAQNIKAEYENGILKLSVPKKEEVKNVKEIKIS